MCTINQALNLSSSSVEIQCKVVCIKVFITESSVYSTALLVDQDGRTIEAKSWSANKSYYIYFNFQTNQSVTLKCLRDSISDDVDRNFSGSNYQASGGPWALYDLGGPLTLTKPISVYSDIQKFHKSPTAAKSLIGSFVKVGGGPVKYGTNNKILARGRFVTLRDQNNYVFKALVWTNPRRKFKSSLDDCNPGDVVLLPYAREQHERYRSGSYYVVTTTYPPVLKSEFVGPIKKSNMSEPNKIFNPYN